MFDTVHKHRRIAQFILVLVIIPFAFFGVDSYFRTDQQTAAVAQVGDAEISRMEFDELLRQQQERMRAAAGPSFDPAVFDSPEVRFALVEQLIAQRLLREQARDTRLRVNDAELAQVIGSLEPFRVDGKFSQERYRQLLSAQNMTPAMFEQRMREELLLAPLQEPLAAANIVARSSGERYVQLLEQRREVAAASVDPAPFEKQVKVDDAQVKAFYDQNQAAFQTPEEARIEYVLLTLPALAARTKVDPADVRKHYDANIASYSKAEERSAAHILVAVKPEASAEQKTAAKKKAEGLLQEARANPARFAELAKVNSEDPGSAGQGGDLGAFAKGSMVKPFEDAVFAAKMGDILGPVETDFGFHVIQVTGVEPGRTRSFDEVRGEIEADLQRQRAQAQFAQSADQMQNLVYEQADSLAPAGKALNVEVVQTGYQTRAQVQALALGNGRFVQALFSPDSIQGKRNTDAIEVGPNALMSGRIIDYKPAAPRPLDEVKDDIRRQLVARGAAELAQKAGSDKLALLEQGKAEKEAALAFGKPVTLQRTQPQPEFPPAAITRIFQADATKLPRYIGAPNERGGFSIYKLISVTTPPITDTERIALASSRLGEQIGRELVNAYIATLRNETEVKINQQALESK